MTAQRIAELTKRGDTVQRELEKLDGEIASAVADGHDDETISQLRQRRRDLIEEADDLGEAINVLEQRANDPAIKQGQANLAKARKEAKRQAERYKQAAGAVDEALRKLEAAFDAMDGVGNELYRALRNGGISDTARIANSLQPALRWAIWHSAPNFAKTMAVSHTPFDKRRSLQDNASRVVPHIPE